MARGVFALVLCVHARWFVLPCLVSPCAVQVSSPPPTHQVHREPIIRSVRGPREAITEVVGCDVAVGRWPCEVIMGDVEVRVSPCGSLSIEKTVLLHSC